MATAYKTPGVYVEEITKFPPSVAEVETAIPAFVGYTSIAKKFSDGDLKNVPTRITNLLEYEQYFGKGPAYSTLTVKLDDNNVPVDTDTTVGGSSYLLYDSIRMFYDNGGGACYIVSVGVFPADVIAYGDNTTGLRGGLEQLKKYDEPTLILFPDAVALAKDQLGALQQAALLQCETLGDRFTIMDVKDSGAGNTLLSDVQDFRDNVGMNSLKYGAAYHPYVNTIYDKTFKFRDINNNITTSGGSKKIKDLVKDTDKDENGVTIKSRLIALESLITDNDNIKTGVAAFLTAQGPGDSLSTIFQSKYQAFISDTASDTKLKSIFNYLFESLLNIDGFLFDNAAEPLVKTKLITNADFLNSAKSFTTNSVKKYLQDLINLDAEALNPGNKVFNKTNTYASYSAKFKSDALKSLTAGASAFITGATQPDKVNQCVAKLNEISKAVSNAYTSITQMGIGFEDTQSAAIIKYIPFYNGILKTLNSKVTLLPPSGAIAGIYASVDNNRGVWKAPANVSINSINGVSEFIDDSIQENLNVDPNAGKSVNAIRPFSGKGVIVWGARTLAGNDNEWRYVPVRRFFSFVEESTKKSTAWAVFEPNDANTWARVRGQIDNFLNNLWRRGALAGAKPEHAYYVNCALGITMTAQDILEGRLIIEIGMAAVRPAEFIVLRFSHKLQQS